MPNNSVSTNTNLAESVSRQGRVKSPFLQEKTTRTTPRTSPSLFTSKLFKRSDEALTRLKDSRINE
ncbi:hypothetical protein CN514_12245 [Bacillus sp. AFS001701]|uniref:hypothetical protein n=1 Tax=Bacillaceae TaxID=186817 RepID=UPI000BF6ED89|nr:hypothetical protein [Bacillus sp. AFS001701]PET65298.1 hypothetical protein CN514_12245 [Bacillus sp. AFS001701]